MPGWNDSFFTSDRQPEIAHLHWAERDRIMEAALRRMVRGRRWRLFATGVFRFMLIWLIIGTPYHHIPWVCFTALAILLTTIALDLFPRKRAMRLALNAELFDRGIRPLCCLRCGYDLRASSDCCPECGTKLAPPLDVSAHASPEARETQDGAG